MFFHLQLNLKQTKTKYLGRTLKQTDKFRITFLIVLQNHGIRHLPILFLLQSHGF